MCCHCRNSGDTEKIYGLVFVHMHLICCLTTEICSVPAQHYTSTAYIFSYIVLSVLYDLIVLPVLHVTIPVLSVLSSYKRTCTVSMHIHVHVHSFTAHTDLAIQAYTTIHSKHYLQVYNSHLV